VLMQQLSLQGSISAAIRYLRQPNVYLPNIGRGRCQIPGAEHVAGRVQYPCGMSLQSGTYSTRVSLPGRDLVCQRLSVYLGQG